MIIKLIYTAKSAFFILIAYPMFCEISKNPSRHKWSFHCEAIEQKSLAPVSEKVHLDFLYLRFHELGLWKSVYDFYIFQETGHGFEFLFKRMHPDGTDLIGKIFELVR